MGRNDRRRTSEDVYDYATGYVKEFVNTICDIVSIDGLEPDVPKSFVISALVDGGRAGFLDVADPSRGFYRFAPNDVPNRYGLFEGGTLTNGAGRTFPVKKNVVEVRANPERYPLKLDIIKYANQLARCDMAIDANIKAATYSRMIGTSDPKEREAIEIAIEECMLGRPAIVDNSIRQAFESSDISVALVAPQIAAVRAQIYADAQRRVGTVSGGQYKKERVQTAEVDASIAETIDNIYIMIDTFNEDCERGGLPYRMRYNGYAAKYDRSEPENNTEEEKRK